MRYKRKQRIEDTKREKKYKCEKCARSYRQKGTLNIHQKYECDVQPQFECKFCGKRFKQKSYINSHINRVHQKTNSDTAPTKYDCNKCTRSYKSLNTLTRHKRVEHAEVKRQFTCDYCSHQSKQKTHLSNHINSQHRDKY